MRTHTHTHKDREEKEAEEERKQTMARLRNELFSLSLIYHDTCCCRRRCIWLICEEQRGQILGQFQAKHFQAKSYSASSQTWEHFWAKSQECLRAKFEITFEVKCRIQILKPFRVNEGRIRKYFPVRSDFEYFLEEFQRNFFAQIQNTCQAAFQTAQVQATF